MSQAPRRSRALRAGTLALAAAALGTTLQPRLAQAAEPAATGKAVEAKPAPGNRAAAAPGANKTAAVPDAAADDVDQDLLEFLGSVDTQTDDSTWFDFLRATDIGKLARERSSAAVPQEKKR